MDKVRFIATTLFGEFFIHKDSAKAVKEAKYLDDINAVFDRATEERRGDFFDRTTIKGKAAYQKWQFRGRDEKGR